LRNILTAANPLLVSVDALVDYDAIRPEHIEPAITQLIGAARSAVESAADPVTPASWTAFVEPLEDASEPLWRAWSVVSHLNAVVNTPALREAYNRCLPRVTEFSTWTGQHAGLFAQYQRLRASDAYPRLTPTRRRIVDLALRDFHLGGVELQGAQRERFAQLSEQAALAAQKFSENVLDARDGWALFIDDESRLEGVPPDVRRTARQAARDDGRDGWKLTLKMPCYLPVMQYAHDRALREACYRGHATLASEQGDPAFDNTPLIEQILALRSEEAVLLGYANYAELALQTRMASKPAEVVDFLRELAHRAAAYAHRDLDELRAFAAEHLGLAELEPWDIAFASERLRESRYDYSDDEVKRYFTEPHVLQGLFDVVGRLFGVTARPVRVSTWHPDVQALRIETADGDVRGHLYLDLYAREGKQGGAWVDSERNRRGAAAGVRTPIAYLTCNFSRPDGDQPALLTHDDVITLFHETGHALHCLLSDVNDPGAAPFSSVEWDAIELPSQFMENFCWEWPVLRKLSAHVDNGAALPRPLFDRLLAARNFQSGMQAVRQIEFGLFDMRIHDQPSGLSIAQVAAILDAVRKEVAVLFPPPWNRFAHGFSHIFAGGYGAGYYSYKWAEVLSADAYAAFEETATRDDDGGRDTLNPRTGRRFLEEILAVGGSRPAAESFIAFRGRPASMDALLRHSGMAQAGATPH
jgi:oligopeptidase A